MAAVQVFSRGLIALTPDREPFFGCHRGDVSKGGICVLHSVRNILEAFGFTACGVKVDHRTHPLEFLVAKGWFVMMEASDL